MPQQKKNKKAKHTAPGTVKYAESINNYTALREAIKHQHIASHSLDKKPKKTGFVIA